MKCYINFVLGCYVGIIFVNSIILNINYENDIVLNLFFIGLYLCILKIFFCCRFVYWKIIYQQIFFERKFFVKVIGDYYIFVI